MSHSSRIMGDINCVTKRCVPLLTFLCPFFISLLYQNYKCYNDAWHKQYFFFFFTVCFLYVRMLHNCHITSKVNKIGSVHLTPGSLVQFHYVESAWTCVLLLLLRTYRYSSTAIPYSTPWNFHKSYTLRHKIP